MASGMWPSSLARMVSSVRLGRPRGGASVHRSRLRLSRDLVGVPVQGGNFDYEGVPALRVVPARAEGLVQEPGRGGSAGRDL
eukprot:8316059-Lingulodinium_polyedra.AAC.1